jgi:hypothetical protein
MYDIDYKPRIAIKAQALSVFMAEWTETQTPKGSWNIGLSISIVPYNFKAREQEFC